MKIYPSPVSFVFSKPLVDWMVPTPIGCGRTLISSPPIQTLALPGNTFIDIPPK